MEIPARVFDKNWIINIGLIVMGDFAKEAEPSAFVATVKYVFVVCAVSIRSGNFCGTEKAADRVGGRQAVYLEHSAGRNHLVCQW